MGHRHDPQASNTLQLSKQQLRDRHLKKMRLQITMQIQPDQLGVLAWVLIQAESSLHVKQQQKRPQQQQQQLHPRLQLLQGPPGIFDRLEACP